MAKHFPCGKEWTGTKAEHCPVCCETFSNTAAGDRHRVGSHDPYTRRCLAPLDAGLVLNDAGRWTLDRPNPFTGSPVTAEQGVPGV